MSYIVFSFSRDSGVTSEKRHIVQRWIQRSIAMLHSFRQALQFFVFVLGAGGVHLQQKELSVAKKPCIFWQFLAKVKIQIWFFLQSWIIWLHIVNIRGFWISHEILGGEESRCLKLISLKVLIFKRQGKRNLLLYILSCSWAKDCWSWEIPELEILETKN